MKDNQIQKAVIEHKNRLLSCGYQERNLLGIFAYGSMNYGTFIQGSSDVDTKAIFVPTLEQLINKSFKVKTKIWNNDEHCEVMDISHLVSNFRKQNINFLELLYTQYNWINPLYEEYWIKYFIEQKEDIARYDINKARVSIAGQAIHTLKQRPLEGKNVGNGIRLLYFLKHYLARDKWEKCLKPDPETLTKILSLKFEVLKKPTIAENLIIEFEELKNVTYSSVDMTEEIDNKMMLGMLAMVRSLDERRQSSGILNS